MNRVKLKDIAEISSGTYQKELADGDLLYLQIKDFTSSHLSKGKLRPSVIENRRTAKYILQNNDLLFAAKGTSNFCAVYADKMGKAVASSVFFVIRLKNAAVLPEYLCWYINAPQIMKRLQANAVGSTIPSITKEMLMDIDINIPAIDVQLNIIRCSQLQEEEYQLRTRIAEKKKQLYNLLLINATKTK